MMRKKSRIDQRCRTRGVRFWNSGRDPDFFRMTFELHDLKYIWPFGVVRFIARGASDFFFYLRNIGVQQATCQDDFVPFGGESMCDVIIEVFPRYLEAFAFGMDVCLFSCDLRIGSTKTTDALTTMTRQHMSRHKIGLFCKSPAFKMGSAGSAWPASQQPEMRRGLDGPATGMGHAGQRIPRDIAHEPRGQTLRGEGPHA